MRTASEQLGEGWAGRTSAATRRRAADLAAATEAAAAQLDRVGRVLQDHATDLADLVARARALEERARAAGLEVRDGRVEIGWGVTGAADAEADRARAATRAALQAELDLVLAQHRRRRDWVLGVLRDSTSGLSRRLAPAARRMRGSPHRPSERTQVRLTTREELNGTVDEVHALLIDPAFQEAKCAATTEQRGLHRQGRRWRRRAPGAHRAPAAVRRAARHGPFVRR